VARYLDAAEGEISLKADDSKKKNWAKKTAGTIIPHFIF
jgi:hypothetical protein